MTIILNNDEVAKVIHNRDIYIDGDYSIGDLLKAQSIHLIEYLEQECKAHHNVYREYNQLTTRRKDCHECMSAIYKELGI